MRNYCTDCGAPNSGTPFCIECGARQPAELRDLISRGDLPRSQPGTAPPVGEATVLHPSTALHPSKEEPPVPEGSSPVGEATVLHPSIALHPSKEEPPVPEGASPVGEATVLRPAIGHPPVPEGASQPAGRKPWLLVGCLIAALVAIGGVVAFIGYSSDSTAASTASQPGAVGPDQGLPGSEEDDPTTGPSPYGPGQDPSEIRSAEPTPRQAMQESPDNLPCDGSFVVIYRLTTRESKIDKTKKWARAADSCSGIDREIAGKPVVFNYRGPFQDSATACKALLRGDLHSDYVKLLRADQSGGRHFLCSCTALPSELPVVNDTGGQYPQNPKAFRAVVDLHLMLKRTIGFQSDNLGMYGQQTRAAVSQYQATQGLAVTGTTDLATWETLLRSDQACPEANY